MRATTIPAQITTIEDKIAGNLNMTQVTLLGLPILFTAFAYSVLPPDFRFALYKLPPVLLVAVVSIILSLRVRGRVLLNWLLVVAKYNLRPGYFVFDKNDEYLREMVLLEKEIKPKRNYISFFLPFFRKKESSQNLPTKSFGIRDLRRLKSFIHNPDYTFSFKVNKKGGVDVALEQIKR